jgi:DnaJ-domain-containing protein 1
MEQMEFREAIVEVRDNSNPLAELDRMLADVKHKLQAYMTAFSELYRQGKLDEARETVRKMQFLFKAQKEIGALSEQLEDELL